MRKWWGIKNAQKFCSFISVSDSSGRIATEGQMAELQVKAMLKETSQEKNEII